MADPKDVLGLLHMCAEAKRAGEFDRLKEVFPFFQFVENKVSRQKLFTCPTNPSHKPCFVMPQNKTRFRLGAPVKLLQDYTLTDPAGGVTLVIKAGSVGKVSGVNQTNHVEARFTFCRVPLDASYHEDHLELYDEDET